MEWYFRVRDLARFSKREQKELIIASIIFGFILSFRMWGGDAFSLSSGVKNWIIASVLVMFTSWWNIYVQKAFSLSQGYKTHHYWWFQGMLAGLVLTFLFL